MDNSRHYNNPFHDYSSSNHTSVLKANENALSDDFKALLTSNTKKLLQKLEDSKKHWTYNDDYSVYTGTAGIAYMFDLYGRYFDKSAYNAKAAELLQICVTKFRSKRDITFLTGLAGPLALAAVTSYNQGNIDESEKMILKLKSMSSHVTDIYGGIPDELLYGRAGYLFSLLYVNSYILPHPIEDDIFIQVVCSIIKSGNAYASSRGYESPLMYEWHDTEYLGGAHGLGGILYLLLQARQYLTESQLKNDILPALYYLQKLRYQSGNFPSSVGSTTDKLVHWCHGAPGMTALYSLAYEVYGDESFLQTAKQCGEVIWSRGLLKKGYGICHGVAGNAYSFLQLYQLTKDPKYLYRACKFAEWCMDYGTHQVRTPDRPFSLFEGLAGTIYFLMDLQRPENAKFPAYTV